MIIIQVCSICKCAKIQRKEWVEVNSGKVIGDCSEETVWCPDCEEQVQSEDFKIKNN